MDNALIIEDLSFHYPCTWFSREKATALKPFSLQVKAGSGFGFLGHNGAGKTTTIKCILGLLKPKTGQIKIFGRDNNDINSRKDVGYLAEQPYFYDNLTVDELLDFFGRLSEVYPREQLKERKEELLERLKLKEKRSARLSSLSKGLMQRLSLIQALLSQPKLLILDEPFSGLDPIARVEFRNLFLELKESGVTLFMSSHVLSDVEFLCDSVSILVNGELKGVYDLSQLEGDSYQLVIKDSDLPNFPMAKKAETISKGFLALEFQDLISANQALGIAIKNSVVIESFSRSKKKLEDLFVEVVKSNYSASHNLCE
jgi:ABC-2 type transport system ATP-binding protein